VFSLYHDVRRRSPTSQHSHNPHLAMTILGEDPYQHVSLSGAVQEPWSVPDLEAMDRLSCVTRASRSRNEGRVSARS
jgi:hypothetical protein